MRRADGDLDCWVTAQIAAEPYQTISFKIQAREIDSASLSSSSLSSPSLSRPTRSSSLADPHLVQRPQAPRACRGTTGTQTRRRCRCSSSSPQPSSSPSLPPSSSSSSSPCCNDTSFCLLVTRFVREGAARPRIAAGGRAADVPRSERKGARTCDARGGSSRGRRHLAHRVKAGTQAEHRVVSLQVGKPSVAIETGRVDPLTSFIRSSSSFPPLPPRPSSPLAGPVQLAYAPVAYPVRLSTTRPPSPSSAPSRSPSSSATRPPLFALAL